MLPQTSHPDPLPLPHRDAVRMTEVMPRNYQAKHGLSAQQSAAIVFTTMPAVLHECLRKAATQLAPAFPQ